MSAENHWEPSERDRLAALENSVQRIYSQLLARDLVRPMILDSLSVAEQELNRGVEEEHEDTRVQNGDGMGAEADVRFLGYAGALREASHHNAPVGRTFFSFRTNVNNTTEEIKRQLAAIVVQKGEELRVAGLTQVYDESTLVENVGSTHPDNLKLCVCSYRAPNIYWFFTVNWVPNTGPQGPGGSFRYGIDTKFKPEPGWANYNLLGSDGSRVATVRYADTDNGPWYGIRYAWLRG